MRPCAPETEPWWIPLFLHWLPFMLLPSFCCYTGSTPHYQCLSIGHAKVGNILKILSIWNYIKIECFSLTGLQLKIALLRLCCEKVLHHGDIGNRKIMDSHVAFLRPFDLWSSQKCDDSDNPFASSRLNYMNIHLKFTTNHFQRAGMRRAYATQQDLVINKAGLRAVGVLLNY